MADWHVHAHVLFHLEGQSPSESAAGDEAKTPEESSPLGPTLQRVPIDTLRRG